MSYVNDADIIKCAQDGDEQALERIVTTNLGLVKSIAVRFLGRGVEFDDLVQIGTIGMIKAIKGFDPSQNCRFTTYAVPMICGEIKRFIRDDGIIKVSRSAKRNAAVILRFCEKYEQKYGEQPSVSKISEETGLTDEDIVFALESGMPVASLYEQNDEDGFALEKLLGEDNIEKALGSIALRESVLSLCKFDRELITLRYFKSMTQEQTARILNVSQVKVSREEKRICRELRKLLE